MKKRCIIASILLVAIIALCTGIEVKKNTFTDQRVATRWSEDRMEQISIFYPVTRNALLDSMGFEDFSHRIQSALDKSAYATAGITDEKGISFPYAVSVTGKVSMEYNGKITDTAAMGVEQRFFTFHPVDLIYGAYLSANDLMDDGIVIDDVTAWNLFGASDVVGKSVNIGGVPHYIRGVFRKEDSRVAGAAGLDKAMCLVSLSSMNKYGNVQGSYCYEVILPDPVDDFANNIIGELLGDDVKELDVVDNTHRYTMGACLGKLGQVGLRSMSTKGIVYPYFENEARAWEDLLAIWYGILAVVIVMLIICIFCIYISFRRTSHYKRLKKFFRPKAPWKWKIWSYLERKNKEEIL